MALYTKRLGGWFQGFVGKWTGLSQLKVIRQCDPMRQTFFAAFALACVSASAGAQETTPAATDTSTASAAATAPAQPIIVGASWTHRPGAHDFERYYPAAAKRQHISGRAVLDCTVLSDGRLTCTVVSENPRGMEFGDAAVNVSHAFRMAARTSDGRSTTGGRVRIPITFIMR